MTIDAHQHFWKRQGPFDYRWLETPEYAPICRDFLPEDLAPRMREAGVERTIFVQTQHDIRENNWALELAARHPFIAGIVGWVNLAGDDCERQVEEYRSHEKFVGVRHVTQDEPDDDFIVSPPILRGLKVLEKHGVPFDLLFFVKHLRHAEALVRKLPDLPMVIDHLAKPKIKAHSLDDWLPDFRVAASFPNVFCKLSGMITEADWNNWSARDLVPYVQAALELFGPDRLMFGSDWPVSELAGTYSQVKQALVDALGPISESEKAKIFGETAERFYGLSPSPAHGVTE